MMPVETKHRAFYKNKRRECWNEDVSHRTRAADGRFVVRNTRRDYTLRDVKREDWDYRERRQALRKKAKVKRETRGSELLTLSYYSSLEKQFKELANRWKKETGHYSTMIHVTRNENYLRIIALGKPIIPYILRDLEKEPDYWFEALRLLTGHNPVSKDHLGDLDKMTSDWLNWGRKEKLI